MAKYKTLKKFKDLEKNEIHEPGDEFEMTVKRAEELEKNLEKWGKDFIERTDNKEEKDGKAD